MLGERLLSGLSAPIRQSVSQFRRGPPRSPHNRLKGRRRQTPLPSVQHAMYCVLGTRSLELLNFASTHKALIFPN